MANADMDIGAGEKKDPLVEYKDDLYVYYKNVEVFRLLRKHMVLASHIVVHSSLVCT